MNGMALCAGAGGLEQGLHLAVDDAYRTVVGVEWETAAALVLVARMQEGSIPPFPIWSDIRTFDGTAWRGVVDIVVAGFPCQPHSVAGKRQGVEDERDLWPDVQRIIGECEPAWVFLENVPGAVPYFQHFVMPGLSDMGYDTEAVLVEAADVGAPHRRERLFVLAHCTSVVAGQGGEQRAGQLTTAPRSRQLADATGSRYAGAGEHGSGSPLSAARLVERSGSLAEPDGARRAEARERRHEHAGSQPEAGRGVVADTGDGQPRCSIGGRASAEQGSADVGNAADGGLRRGETSRKRRQPAFTVEGLANAELTRLERRVVAGEGDGRPDTDAGRPGAFPPRPDDAEGWERVLRERPDLAPALSINEEWDVGLRYPLASAKAKPPFRRVADGLADRLDLTRAARLRLCGNGVVPQQAAYAFGILRERFGVMA